ncbi:MAG TPA: hypothetical protein VF981_03875 [Gemmatimonadaceae bacterium]
MTDAPFLGQLRATARAEADTRRAAAGTEAQRLLLAAQERLARQRSLAIDGRRADLARERDRRLDAARAEAGRSTLAARERFLERVFSSVHVRAPAQLAQPEGAEWLARTVTDALSYLPDGPVVVRTGDSRAITIVGNAAPGRSAAVEPAGDSPGAVVEAADGSVRVVATLDRFLRAERPRLALALVSLVRTT